MHPVSWKNSLFLSCSCNLQHSLEFTEHSIPSRDDSTPGEPVHGLGFQSSGINQDNCVRRKPTRRGACGAGSVVGRDVGVYRCRLQGLGVTLQEQHALCLSHLLQTMSLAAAAGPHRVQLRVHLGRGRGRVLAPALEMSIV